MAKPFAMARGIPVRVCFAASLVMAGAMMPDQRAHAFDEGSESAVIGTFHVGSDDWDAPARGAAGPARLNAEETWPAPAANAAAASRALYHDALSDLELGNSAAAQQGFERLIAADPDGAFSRRARQHLARLYANAFSARYETSAARAADGDELAAAPPADATPVPSVSARPPAAHKAAWVSPDSEMEFIVEAGDRVFFGAGSAEIGARARLVLAAQARWLVRNPTIAPVIEGYADDAPEAPDQDLALAKARAEAVRQRLIEEGVESGRLSIAYYGRDQRVAQCESADCAVQNRRVVTALIPTSPNRAAATSGAARRPVPQRAPADTPAPVAQSHSTRSTAR